ncbi:cytidylate kinase family protein [Caenimonas aquaedulcis]|uniref:Cytidylate kinase family protein n=1 Tax=Caenimonas aquaedulcis TaxID=2793270 RepID=A0A931H125_9BURK|nr:cytidylate kinase family protein [Caenimonas aquaedulcis]MBG9386607.1 cytidylate kinase family protein [Caenimonas aquaedulcis]
MPVIALTQEMGSLAKDVAIELGRVSQLEVLRHEVLEGVAGRMQVSTSLISRLREGKAGLMERLKSDHDTEAVYTAKEVYALAGRGNVVLRGWGATCLLRDVPHVVTVRITRSFDKRVDWLMEHLGTDDRDFAQAEVRRSDDAHATRMHDRFGVTWGDPLLYDLVLNTDRVTVESCAAQILHLAGRPEFAETEASRAKLQSLALNSAIRAALRDNESTREVNIEVDSSQGKVVLQGIVLNDAERSETARVASAVAGAGNVDNQLRIMAVTRRFAHAKT